MIRFLLAPLLLALAACATSSDPAPSPAFASERIGVEVVGSGPDVVLVPGLSSSPEEVGAGRGPGSGPELVARGVAEHGRGGTGLSLPSRPRRRLRRPAGGGQCLGCRRRAGGGGDRPLHPRG